MKSVELLHTPRSVTCIDIDDEMEDRILYLPQKNEDIIFNMYGKKVIVEDVDGCRVLYLMCINSDKRQFAIPKDLMGTFDTPERKSGKVCAYSIMVIMSIGVTDLLATLYVAYVPSCTPAQSNVPPMIDHCVWQNTFLPNTVLCLGSMMANIGGLCIYDYLNQKYEGLRNQSQDSAVELEKIYISMAKFTLRTYFNNLNLAKDYYLRYNDGKKSIKPENTARWERKLDKYLTTAKYLKNDKAVSVRFDDIFRFLDSFEDILDKLRQVHVTKKTIRNISVPFEEITKLLLSASAEALKARRAINELIFGNTEFKAIEARYILDLITHEDLTGYVNNLQAYKL